MKYRKLLCVLLALALLLALAPMAGAEGDLFFVAVNDTIPVTLTSLPYTSGGVVYVPYTAFDARPGGVVSAYNATAQTFVLFTKDSRLVFDLATGETSDENQNTSTQTALFRNGLLYIPLIFCASHFGLKVSMLESQDGYPVLRFTTGSEVYDDSLFIEKAENLIAYRVQQYAGGGQTQDKPSERPGGNPGTQTDPAAEKKPATVFLAFTDSQTMRDSMAALKKYSLQGSFFLTEDEILTDPALVFELLAAGHTIGLTVPDGEADPAAALARANDALAALVCQKTLLALLPAGAEAAEGYCCFFRPAAPVTAAEAAASETAHLLVCSADADAALYTLYTSDARTLQLLETSDYA